MRRFKLHRDLTAAAQLLATFAPEAVSRLAAELESKLTLKLYLDPDIEDIVSKNPDFRGLDADNRELLVQLVSGVHILSQNFGKSPEVAIERIAEQYERQFEGSEEACDQHLLSLKENLRTLLNIHVVRVSAKALDLLSDRDNLFLGCRVLSNIRPILDNDLSKPFAAYLVTHTLKIATRDSSGSKDLYISVDTADLHVLQDAIERAIQKGTAIVNQIESGIGNHFGRRIEPPEEEL